ncbi:hypothetical protein WA538_002394 [Blastocystis sp. DL]
MTLEASSQDHTAEALDVRKVMPSKRAISALGSVTNGFLFSTTPIISRILQELYPKADPYVFSRIASEWLWGSIIGILVFGFVGDTLGYYTGMILATSWDSSLLIVFGLCRILTGFGCGGSIPIAYTRTSSSHSSEVSSTGSILLLLQSSSWLLGPVLFNVCLNVFPSATVTVLKAILFAAAVPSLISLVCVLYSANTIVYVPLQSVESSVPSEVEYPPLWRAFLRTGVSWLLYDFNSYGNTFFSRQIIRSLFPIPDSPLGATIPLIIAGLFGVPGQMAVHGLLRRWDVRQVQRLGFGMMAVLFVLVAFGIHEEDSSRSLQFILFVL